VLIYSQTVVPPEIIGRAQDTTTGIFHHLDVDVAWREVSTRTVSSSDYIVRLVTAAPPASANALGFAIVGTHMASVQYPRVEQLATASGMEIATVLGDVIAHELGHLLLGSARHSLNGIMQSEFNLLRAEQGSVLFPDEQARLIRAAITQPSR